MSLLLKYIAGSGGVTATLSVTEDNDTLASIAVVPVTSSISVTEEGDTLSSSSVVAITATASITEDEDTLSSTSAVTAAEQNGNVYTLKERIRRDDEQVMRLVIEAFTKLAA